MARFGDRQVTYAVFLRRPVISAPRLMLDWLATVGGAARHASSTSICSTGKATGSAPAKPIVYLTGSLMHMSDLETILLQKIGPACVAAHNAYQMALSLPKVAFPGDGGAATAPAPRCRT